MELTDPQWDAITYDCKNMQLLACAGSGKTEVVARRVVHLLKPQPDGGGLKPKNIVAFTYTKKAAGELKARITKRCREEFGDLLGLAEMFVGTIHSFCLNLIKTEVPKYLKFEELNDVQSFLFTQRNSIQSGLSSCETIQGQKLRRNYYDTKLYLGTLFILREATVNHRVLAKYTVSDSLAAYKALLDRARYLDYSAQLECARDVLKNDDRVRTQVSDRIRYVIVDEYQDVNPVQEEIIRLLHDLGAKICVVGDDDQTIYQWRGSEIENILTFTSRYPHARTFPLNTNFRSSCGIVETARPFIEQNTNRLAKQMVASETGGYEVSQEYEAGDITALSFESPAEEAKFIAQTIKALRGVAFKDDKTERGLSWSDMAVLLRSVKNDAQEITKALDAADIRYVIIGMKELFDTAEAEAARQLFYFMGDHKNIDEKQLENAWKKADLGFDDVKLRLAIEAVAQAKRALYEPNQRRWSTYNIQRVFRNFLDDIQLREENVPNRRGETVFYNLGKFSEIISDFESIHFRSKPDEKYRAFAKFLEFDAEHAYPEGWQDNQYANPDAVRIMTIHQAKGMQWPVVFLPVMLKNKFPPRKPGGRNAWHIIPHEAVVRQERFEGTLEDERRLFYVAMTRSRKFLHVTYAPIGSSQQASEFYQNILRSKWVKRLKPDYSNRRKLKPEPSEHIANVIFSFSDLKYFFECPYQFKLRILYGFNAPLDEALGYGKSLHNALAEIHKRSIEGEIIGPEDVPQLIATHLHLPYAFQDIQNNAKNEATKVLNTYIVDNRDYFDKLEFFEQDIEIALDKGVTVNGRIDLVRRIDTGEVTIVDFKTREHVQTEAVTEAQLHVYALGYQQLTGNRPDYVETYELEEGNKVPRSVDDDFINDVKIKVKKAADALRSNELPPEPVSKLTITCDYPGMCAVGCASKPK